MKGMKKKEIACINRLAEYLAVRDVPQLTADELEKYCGKRQVDVMALFGGTILSGADVLADAIRQNVAKHYVIVGGVGHMTDGIRYHVHKAEPSIDTGEMTEAEALQEYLKIRHGLAADFLEMRSSNCGNNITLLLELLQEEGIDCQSIILSQDGAITRRMKATLLKYRPDMEIINYASYQVMVEDADHGLRYDHIPEGMWEMQHYISLLMGEIPRLRDDENGYGPKGKDFISHVDIPEDILDAYLYLEEMHEELVRGANPAYAKEREK